jgi:two-component system sensor histidine kinase CiaH
MFNQTRRQLTVRNALVLFVILIVLSIALYSTMRVKLLAQVDKTLNNMMSEPVNLMKISTLDAIPVFDRTGSTFPNQSTIRVRLSNLDRPVYELMWLSNDRFIHTPLTNELLHDFSESDIQQFSPSRYDSSPYNVKVGKQFYRVLTINEKKIDKLHLVSSSNQAVESLQYIINITTEIDMLHSLLYVLIIGGGLGLIITIIAGFYLANRALIPIQQSWDMQQLFVSDASHELRTPLSVIQAHTELLLRHPEQTIEQESRYISTILKETKRMNKLVNSLLTLARVDSNQTELDIQPIHIDQVMKDVIDQMSYLAQIKQIVIHTELDEGVLVQADVERIHQLFIILLDNALKYTQEHGFIQANVKKYTQTVIIEIIDNGMGISKQDLPFIFDRFFRGDKARTRAEGGTGLGLSIARWIVEGHNGKIHAESKSTGTRFVISMPLLCT